MDSLHTPVPRPEHPRPDFQRPTFYNLNGAWQFAFDDEDAGLQEKWMVPGKALPLTIQVPFCYQSKASGIGPTDEIHPIVWYRRSFQVPADMEGKRILLRFGAVDYACSVYVNGQMAGTHKGGYTPFALDITLLLQPGENDLCLRVQDDPDVTQPRGKQYWKQGLMGCWYTPVTGIWQTVYLEAAGHTAMTRIHVMPDVDRHMIRTEIALDRSPAPGMQVDIRLTFDGKPFATLTQAIQGRIVTIPMDMMGEDDIGMRLWTPDHPNLYDMTVTLCDAAGVEDQVTTYFGMRKVEVRNGKVYLNNCPLYQRLILDQGYWPDTLLTPPSDEAIQLDLTYTKAFGYNGARKHQKVEDPRYYYWADQMGVLVWGEVPSPYLFTDETGPNLVDTLTGFIDRDFNHPSIIAWVPLNESWGVRQIFTDPRQQALGRTLYHLTKALDGTRLCSGNDGWEQTTTDICALHDYAADGETMAAHFAAREAVEAHGCDWRPCWAAGEVPTGKEAFLVTEYGGIAFSGKGTQGEMGGMETWGYHGKVTDEEAFFQRFQGVTDAIRALPYCQGYCYTQLTDVMQEINGLLSPSREPKVDVERFRRLNVSPTGITNQVD